MTDDLPSRFPEAAPERTATIAGVPITIAAMFAVAMIVLALIGAGATLANVSWAERYWLWLVPIFGVICTLAAWMRTGTLDRTVIRQVLHWLAVGVTIAIDFSFFRSPASIWNGASRWSGCCCSRPLSLSRLRRNTWRW